MCTIRLLKKKFRAVLANFLLLINYTCLIVGKTFTVVYNLQVSCLA